MNILFCEKKRSRIGEIVSAKKTIKPKKTVAVKCRKSEIHRKSYAIPDIQFEDQKKCCTTTAGAEHKKACLPS